MQQLPDESVDMVMTSPPYWGLRDYGHDDQLGLEPTSKQYVRNLTDVFTEVRRVLKPTGTFFLNISDTYGGSSGQHGSVSDDFPRNRESYDRKLVARNADIPDKCLAMVPERVALALVDDGWLLRNKVVWEKPNPMPESVKDRFSTTWEYIYMFSKQQQYYFDLDAVREPYADQTIERRNRGRSESMKIADGAPGQNPHSMHDPDKPDPVHPCGKNPGDTWEITTAQMSEAHFAVYPEKLCERPVKAGCPPMVCASCGRPYERVVETQGGGDNSGQRDYSEVIPGNRSAAPQKDWKAERRTKGWNPQCDCGVGTTEKGIVLDPFAGAGTTCLVARKHNRHYLGIELNEEYAEMARTRIKEEVSEKPIDEFMGSAMQGDT